MIGSSHISLEHRPTGPSRRLGFRTPEAVAMAFALVRSTPNDANGRGPLFRPQMQFG